MAFPRQEYWSGLPFPSLGDLLTQGWSLPVLPRQAGSLPLNYQGNPVFLFYVQETQSWYRAPWCVTSIHKVTSWSKTAAGAPVI